MSLTRRMSRPCWIFWLWPRLGAYELRSGKSYLLNMLQVLEKEKISDRECKGHTEYERRERRVAKDTERFYHADRRRPGRGHRAVCGGRRHQSVPVSSLVAPSGGRPLGEPKAGACCIIVYIIVAVTKRVGAAPTVVHAGGGRLYH